MCQIFRLFRNIYNLKIHTTVSFTKTLYMMMIPLGAAGGVNSTVIIVGVVL